MTNSKLDIRGITKEQKERLSELALKTFGSSNVSAFVRYLIHNALDRGEKKRINNPIEITSSNKKTITFRLYEEEHQALTELAKQTESTAPFYCSSLIKTHLHGKPYLLKNELEQLRDANYQLSAIGRNLNQIARHLNANTSVETLTLEQINIIRKMIKTHVEKMNDVISSNVERLGR